MNAKALKKQFENFMYIGNESLDELITRFYHLLIELHANEVITSTKEKVQCLADALPTKWESFLMVAKQNRILATTNLNTFIQSLREQEVENRWRAKRGVQIQNPGLYFSTPTPSAVQTSAPLQTAFTSNSTQTQAPSSQSPTNTSQYSHPPSNSHTPSTANTSTSTSQPSGTSRINVENFKNISVEVATEHMALLSAVLKYYDSLVAGQIGNSHLT